jgi:hypothetical protein
MMTWIFVGILAGSLVTSTHDNKEACEGRAVTMKEKGVIGGRCTETPSTSTSWTLSPCATCVVPLNR